MLDFRHETFLALCRIKNYTKTAEFLGEELARKMLAAGGLKIMTDLGCM